MAHFSYGSSPESDNSAVEDIISQAKDLSVLEQIAALNSPHCSVLPTHLETRFNRLRSLPPSLPSSFNPQNFETPTSQNQPTKTPTPSPSPLNPQNFITPTSQNQPTKTPTSSPPPPEKSEKPKDPNLNSVPGSVTSPSISFSPPPPPPLVKPPSSPPLVCCFWCSPKKLHKKKIRKDWAEELDLDDEFWGKNDEILSDLGSFSLKEQRRKLKKAWKEEEKVAREAEKIVKWAREASARMEASAIEDSTSDDEKCK